MSETIRRNDIIKKLRCLKPELEKRYGVTRIGVLGSVSGNEAHFDGDMVPDLLKRVSLKAELELFFDKKVDVVRYWHGMNNYLKARIDQEAVYA